jgi:hypothetical protein
MDKPKQTSISQQFRAVGYLKPSDHIFLEAYTKVHEVSRSSIVETAVHQFIQSIPPDIRIQIVRRAKNEY